MGGDEEMRTTKLIMCMIVQISPSSSSHTPQPKDVMAPILKLMWGMG
jgi:hypothetical protein